MNRVVPWFMVKTKFIVTKIIHISSNKIRTDLGFVAKHTIRDAVEDLCLAFDKNLLPNSLDDEMYFNIKRMNNLELN